MRSFDDLGELFPLAEETAREFPSTGAADQPAWEMIDVGRYQPKRIRGSCRGRALG